MIADARAILRSVLNLRLDSRGLVTPHAQRIARRCGPASVTVLAMGKAALPMTLDACEALGDRVREACVLLPRDHAGQLPAELERSRGTGTPPMRCEIHPCDHPFPTPANMVAARSVEAWMHACPASATLLALISGGASAYLCSPAHGVTLEDVVAITRALQRAGATIRELNTVRKHVETLKGGRLAQACNAGNIEALVMSDVLGDPLDVIASGPLSPDPTTFRDALSVLDRFGLRRVARSITAHLEAGARGEHPETPKRESDLGRAVAITIVASNTLVVDDVVAVLRDAGVASVQARERVQGEARDVARELVAQARALRDRGNDAGEGFPLAACVFGGEWTVTVDAHGSHASGVGGPSQELALAALLGLAPSDRVGVATLSTDGVDGPTDAAGALVMPEHLEKASRLGVDLRAALARHDSHRALDALGVLHRTGPTGTNLNHVAVALAW